MVYKIDISEIMMIGGGRGAYVTSTITISLILIEKLWSTLSKLRLIHNQFIPIVWSFVEFRYLVSKSDNNCQLIKIVYRHLDVLVD